MLLAALTKALTEAGVELVSGDWEGKKRKDKRQISLGGGFILKGGGWYADLYSSSGKSSGVSAGSKTTGSGSPGCRLIAVADVLQALAQVADQEPAGDEGQNEKGDKPQHRIADIDQHDRSPDLP